MADPILISAADGVQTIRFNRPDKKNAITTDMYGAMADALQAGDADDSVRVHLFLGCEGAFTAGNDIGDFIRAATDGGLGGNVLRFLKALASAAKPVVAGVDGLAIGVGTTMILHCDLAYASPRALFRTPFVDLGLLPEAASSLLAPRLMGHVRAFELLAAGKPFSAEQALACGMINAVVDENDLESAALGAAANLAGKPPEALLLARRLLRGDPADVLRRIDEEAEHFVERLRSHEAQAAFAAFMNRDKA
ncbi:MAG TPA: crotonase/enoyl-CoA hydratase family protein [Afifellaceae bacterium]|nr:crotonase/enoyl-CoA hydratase family protein [Afifellaceae bacterium]